MGVCNAASVATTGTARQPIARRASNNVSAAMAASTSHPVGASIARPTTQLPKAPASQTVGARNFAIDPLLLMDDIAQLVAKAPALQMGREVLGV